MIDLTIEKIIRKVDQGKFDAHLKILENTNLGIFINSYVTDGKVSPIPNGYHQSEHDLHIQLKSKASDNDVQVGWFGKKHTLCSGHPDCEDRKHFGDYKKEDPLADATELNINSVQKTFEKYRYMLDELFVSGLGIFMVHGHSNKYAFTELPPKWIAVIEKNQTHFRLRSKVINLATFVPNIWRMENGARQVVGCFIL
jgi:hypothetical protein